MKKLLTAFFVLPLIALLLPFLSYAFDDTLEKDLQKSLHRGKTHVKKTKQKVKKGGHMKEEVAALKAYAEEIKTKHSLILERFRKRGEEVRHVSFKAEERHREMEEGYRKAMEEYLSRIDSLPSHGRVSQKEVDDLDAFLEKIVSKKRKPLIGTLPYRNLNYPSREPNQNPPLKPAYKGGTQPVSPDDTKDTEEAPISEEIASLAQSLNWNPVSIYEYVKNNVETEWYRGCMKGAEETLIHRSGNDCDQASLLVALLRASGFPARYVRGTIEFFASNGKPIEKIRNLTGIEDPWKIAEFFQKAGIPYKPVIAGGTITNFQIEHIWVESLIPYANYRGAIIDDQGKTWLGLDTSIKVKGYTYNTPTDIFQQSALSNQLSAIRDEYLSTGQSQTPLEYMKQKLTAMSGQPSESYELKRTLMPEVLNLLPASMQFTEVKITNEYTGIPDELKHKVRFVATDSQSSELLSFEIESFKLSNQQIVLVYEPETVEDQQIIDYYGGLDNTPAYLVRLRPVLKVNGERLAVGTNGLPMGADTLLTIEVMSPNGKEKIQTTHITGNLAAIGIVSQKALASEHTAISEEDDAETILFKETNRYIDRWNKAEEELASLMHLIVTRPIPAVMTVGGVIDVAYVFGTPHSFTWKGVYADANLRAVETAMSHQPSANSQDQRQKLFMQLSALQGSVLEHRIFEDDFQVDSISTAKLMQISSQQSAISSQFFTIDKTNIDSVLPLLDLDEDIEGDIRNSVNGNLVVRMPSAEGLPLTTLSYLDWTGLGYIKENPDTGESGYMLSGMLASSSPDLSGIAGGMSALIQWVLDYLAEKLGKPNTKEYNKDPMAAAKIIKTAVTDKQEGTVNTQLPQPLAVLVLDKNNRPVKGASVTFKVITGGGKTDNGVAYTTTTGQDGIAKATLTLGRKTSDNPVYRKLKPVDEFVTQTGLNLVGASVTSASGDIPLAQPFEAYGKPGRATEIVKVLGDGNRSMANNPGGSLIVKLVDRYENPISNAVFTFSALEARSREALVPLPNSYRNIEFYVKGECAIPYPLYNECPTYKSKDVKTEYFGAAVNTMLGNTVNTVYTVRVSLAPPADKQTYFTLYSDGFRNKDDYIPPGIYVKYIPLINEKGEKVDAAKVGTELKAPLTAEFYMMYDEYTLEGPYPCPIVPTENCYWMKPSGIVQAKPITNGTVTFTAVAGAGTVTPTENLGNGKYRTRYTTGLVPVMNIVEVSGEADITVPAVLLIGTNECLPIVLPSFSGDPMSDPNYRPLCTTAQPIYRSLDVECIGDKCDLRKKTVRLKAGQQITFNDKLPGPLEEYAPQIVGEEQKLSYLVYGVLPEITGTSPNLMLLDSEGYLAHDTTITYTIKPPDMELIKSLELRKAFEPDEAKRRELQAQIDLLSIPYNARIADVDVYERPAGSTNLDDDVYVFSLTGSATQGEGTAIIHQGEYFDLSKDYYAEVVLNRGSDAEVRGERKALLFGQFRIVDYDEAQTVMQGAVTDGAAKLRLQLIAKGSQAAYAGLMWKIVDPQLAGTNNFTVGRGTLLDEAGNPTEALPVTFNANGIAEAVYQAPTSFVRWGTPEEANDKERPERHIQPTIDLVRYLLTGKDMFPPIRLKRPPVVLVHGLWGSGARKSKNYSWKGFDSQLNSKGLYDVTITDYHDTHADSISTNIDFIEMGINDAVEMLKEQKLATSKIDIIGNSMGGLLPREYCRVYPEECKKRVHKFITTDSPHQGSELANLINTINQQRAVPCISLLGIMQLSGKQVWNEDGTIKGALIDLSVGSTTLQNLANSPRTLSWNAIVGRAQIGLTPFSFFAHDKGLNVLWSLLALYCNKVPDSSFVIFPGLETVFSGDNDRIVSEESQSAFANQYFKISGVDHLTVLKESETVKKVQEILEKP